MERSDIHQKQISRLRTVSSARNDIQRQFYGYIAGNTVRDGKDILPRLNYSRIRNGSARKRKTLAEGCIFFSFLKFFFFLKYDVLRTASSTSGKSVRNHDAHFCVTPMDVYLFDGGTMTNGNQEKTQTLTLVQTHLLPVDVYDRKPDDWNDDRDGEWKPTWQKRIYMEAYEEYLDHYDPLDEYNVDHIYAGLPWAKNGSTLASSKIPDLRISLFSGDDRKLDGAVDNYYSGWGYTSYMVQEQGNPDMTLDTKPESAAEYCYNKNVRQDDNSIPWDARDVFIVGWTIYEDGSKWFLPGIREMEDALTQYYSNYNEFQTNFYWSSSAAKRRWQVGDGAGPYQEKTRARATKVLSNGKYAESAYDEDNYTDENGTGGRALRTQELRIRAFRTDLEPVE